MSTDESIEETRRKLVERNREVLVELGLNKRNRSHLRVKTARQLEPPRLLTNKRSYVEGVESVERRRSDRIATAGTWKSGKFKETFEEDGRQAKRTRSSRAAVRNETTNIAESFCVNDSKNRELVLEDSRTQQSRTTTFAKNSSKSLLINTSILKNNLWKQIIPLDGQVKRAAMAVASPISAFVFNKMSGIAEWANAVYLFVNVDPEAGSKGQYENTFSLDPVSGRVRMAWYAQRRMTPESPLVLRIRRLMEENIKSINVVEVKDVRKDENNSPVKQETLQPPLVKEESRNTLDTSCSRRSTNESVATFKTRDTLHLFFRSPSSFYIYAGQVKPVQFYPQSDPVRFDVLLEDLSSITSGSDDCVARVLSLIRSSASLYGEDA